MARKGAAEQALAPDERNVQGSHHSSTPSRAGARAGAPCPFGADRSQVKQHCVTQPRSTRLARVVRFGLAVQAWADLPPSLPPNSGLASYRRALSSRPADRSAWVAAFSGGDATRFRRIVRGKTTRCRWLPGPRQQPPRTHGMVRLPPVFAERRSPLSFLAGSTTSCRAFHRGDYARSVSGTLSRSRLILRSPTVTVRCTQAAVRYAGSSVEGIWVAGGLRHSRQRSRRVHDLVCLRILWDTGAGSPVALWHES